MKKYQSVFERYEKKYRLSCFQWELLMERLEPYFTQDDYGLHTICNLYYDTEDYQLIRTSLDKPRYKEKLRLRSYGIPGQSDRVFLELKKKYAGVVYKRRISLPLYVAEAFLGADAFSRELMCRQGSFAELSGADRQILSEIDWFLKRYQPSAKVFLAYDRAAFYGKENPELRITFDQKIRWREQQLDLSKGDWGQFVTDPREVLMEIKISGAMPIWLSVILAELAIFPASFSKYGTCYQKFLAVPEQTGGIICA